MEHDPPKNNPTCCDPKQKWPKYGDRYLYRENGVWLNGLWSDTPYDRMRCAEAWWKPVVSQEKESTPKTTAPDAWEKGFLDKFTDAGYEDYPSFLRMGPEKAIDFISSLLAQARAEGRNAYMDELILTVGGVVPMSAESAINPGILARDIKEILEAARADTVAEAVQKIDNLWGQEVIERGNAPDIAHKNYLEALDHARTAISRLVDSEENHG